MFSNELDCAGRLLRFNPNCSHASKQRKWIITNELAGPGDVERNRTGGKRASTAILVSDTHDYAGSVDAVSDKFAIVGLEMELLVAPFPDNVFEITFLPAM